MAARNAVPSTVHIMIEVNERIEVAAAAPAVWAVLSDPQAVAECVPGAALGEKQEDGSYDATLMVKFGPAKVSFKARFTLELDPAALSGRVESKARDNQGGTRVKTSMAFSVAEGQAAGSSVIPITAQVEVGGKLASLVESGASIVVKQMTKEFTERLAKKLAGASAA
jgi:carbon monoxide dehydrogenase subunit G